MFAVCENPDFQVAVLTVFAVCENPDFQVAVLTVCMQFVKILIFRLQF